MLHMLFFCKTDRSLQDAVSFALDPELPKEPCHVFEAASFATPRIARAHSRSADPVSSEAESSSAG